MPTKALWVAVAAIVVIAAVVVAWAQGGQDQKPAAQPEGPRITLPPDQQVVAAVPYQYETEYEMDPFDRTILRRTKTRVTHILVVHADGSSEVRPAD